jgi:2-hydroxy-3-keto-5-methylthiopentenyl-1-phosphate phosphatase
VPTAVFVDYDGTITDVDTFDVLVRRLAGDGPWKEIDDRLDRGELSLRAALEEQAGLVRVTFEAAADLLEREVHFDPTFAAFVAACEARDVPVTIVSSGVESLIRRALAREGLERLPVVANEVEPWPAGWRIRFRDAVGNGTDKAALVKAARERGARAIYIGDGHSDYEAALSADRAFAKRGRRLERYLARRGIPFETFATFAEVTQALLRAA